MSPFHMGQQTLVPYGVKRPVVRPPPVHNAVALGFNPLRGSSNLTHMKMSRDGVQNLRERLAAVAQVEQRSLSFGPAGEHGGPAGEEIGLAVDRAEGVAFPVAWVDPVSLVKVPVPGKHVGDKFKGGGARGVLHPGGGGEMERGAKQHGGVGRGGRRKGSKEKESLENEEK